MRLREIQGILGDVIPVLRAVSIEAIPVKGSSEGLSRIVGAVEAVAVLRRLAEAPLGPVILNQVRALLTNPLLAAQGAQPVVTPPEAERVVSQIKAFVHDLRLAAQIIDAAAPPTHGDLVLVKLPPEESLAATAKVLEGLGTAFDLLLARLNERPLKVEGVDTGSVWMVLSAATPAALHIIRRLIEALATLIEARGHFNAQMAFMRAVDADAEIRKEQEALNVKAQKKLIEGLSATLAVDPTGTTPIAPDQELVRTYVHSLTTLQELSNRGAEIRLLAATRVVGQKSEIAAVGERGTAAALPSAGAPDGEPPPSST